MRSSPDDVTAAVHAMTEAFHAGQLDAVMASYEPDAAVVFEPGSPVQGRASISEKFVEAFALQPRFDYAGHEVTRAGDLALHIAPWTMQATAPDGSTIEQQGLSVAVFRRQPDGRWLMAIDNPHGQRLLPA